MPYKLAGVQIIFVYASLFGSEVDAMIVLQCIVKRLFVLFRRSDEVRRKFLFIPVTSQAV